jgi:hypothetical protein
VSDLSARPHSWSRTCAFERGQEAFAMLWMIFVAQGTEERVLPEEELKVGKETGTQEAGSRQELSACCSMGSAGIAHSLLAGGSLVCLHCTVDMRRRVLEGLLQECSPALPV